MRALPETHIWIYFYINAAVNLHVLGKKKKKQINCTIPSSKMYLLDHHTNHKNLYFFLRAFGLMKPGQLQ